MRVNTHTNEWGTPAHSHACTQSHGDGRAIGCNRGEANSWSWLLMATGSRGAGKDVDNDNVTPSQPAPERNWILTQTDSGLSAHF